MVHGVVAAIAPGWAHSCFNRWNSLKIKTQNDEHETFRWSFLVGLRDMVKVCSDIFKKHTVFVFRISGCETGVLKESIIHRFSVFERKILR